jgi:ribosomal protein S12 methylthiotransferase accessory factor
MDEIEVSFPGGKRVDARIGSHVIQTDQPETAGGDGSAPSPYDLFLASIATCAGIYVLGFCQARGLSIDGIELRQRVEPDPVTKLPSRIELELTLPPSFPERLRPAIARAAEHCKVKSTIAAAPRIDVRVVSAVETLARAS